MSAVNIFRFVLVFLQYVLESLGIHGICTGPLDRDEIHTQLRASTHSSSGSMGLLMAMSPNPRIKIFKISIHKIKLRQVGPLGEGARDSVHSI